MEILTREKIRRMVNVTGTGVGGGSIFDTGQINEILDSYLTVENAKQQFVSIDFFKRLFQAHGTDENDDPVDVDPNDTETTITDIEAMFGFWTDQYLSALGNGGGGGTGGATALTDLVDVAIASPTNGQALVYNSTTGKWTNQTISGGGTDMATVWSALNAATSEQINASHLTNALSGYATSSDLTGYLPLSAGSSKPLTGSLYFSGNSGINWSGSIGMLACAPSTGWTGISSTQWGVGAIAYQGVIRTNNNDILHYKSGTTYKIWDESNLDISGLFTALTSTNATNLTVTIGGTTKTITNLYALCLKGVQVTADTVSYGDLNSLTGTSYSIVTNYNSNSNWQHAPTIQTGNYWGGAVVVKGQDNNLMMQLFWNAKHNESTTPTGKLWFRARTDGGWGDDWKELVFADGNIATATAIATARTLWGQSFDGSANVSGNMTDVGTIDATGDNTITHSGTTASRFIAKNGVGQVELMVASSNWGVYSRTNSNWIIGTNGTNTFMSIGNVGIGTTTPSYLLHVNGQAAAQTFRSTVETGTAPLVVASSTLVSNLNADLLDGKHSTDFASASDVTTLQGYFDSSGAALSAVQLKTTRTLWGQSFDGTGNVTGAMTSVGSITLTNNSRISNATGSSGSLYIGRSDDAGWVKMSDMCSRQGDSYWKIKSNGDATFGNMLSNGYVTALSDARYKTIVGNIDITVEQIASLPTILYKRNDLHDDTIFAGSIAQEWQKVLPQVVMTSNDYLGTLSIAHGVGASIFVIVTARKVVNLEKRIERLEKRVNIEQNKTE